MIQKVNKWTRKNTKNMRKIILIISVALFIFVAFFVIDVYQVVSQNPNTTYGHLILRDRT